MRKATLRKLQGEQVAIDTGDGRTIDAVWLPGKQKDAPTVVVYHGNGQILDKMIDQAHFFQLMGTNVLLITMGGYPNSSEGR